MYAVVILIPLLMLPETYGPVLLQRRAKRIRKQDPTSRVIAPHELERKNLKELAQVVLTRPVRMILFEPIVSCICVYLSLTYSIFYMSFQAYPLIFQGVYGLSPGVCGLTYLPIGGGCLLAIPLFWSYDSIVQRAKERNEAWVQKEEYRRLPLACIGGPIFVISLFWLGWSVREGGSFVVPMLAGIPFGLGSQIIFMALL
jgi:hypothetical protein